MTLPLMRGGLEALSPGTAVGRGVQIGPPPRTVAAEVLRLGCSGRPGVVVGERVSAGDVLYESVRPGGDGRVSPVTGTVRAVTGVGGGRWEVTLTPGQGDGSGGEGEGGGVSTWLRAPVPEGEAGSWSAALRRWGPWPQPGLRSGLASQLEAAARRRPDRLVLVGLDRYPPCPVRSSVLLSFPQEAVAGLDALRRAVGLDEAVLLTARGSGVSDAVEAAVEGAVRGAVRGAVGGAVRVVESGEAYPAADPTVLAASKLLGRRRLDADAPPMDAGLMLIEPWSAVRLGRWVSRGELDTIRPVMVTFPDAVPMSPRWAMPGQSLATLARQAQAAAEGGRVLLGDLMTGEALTLNVGGGGGGGGGVAVGDDWELVTLLPERGEGGQGGQGGAGVERTACIDCGWCVEACPTRLMPIRLLRTLEREAIGGRGGRGGGRVERARAELSWCIECGLCSAVCPSGIPLTQRLRTQRREREREA